MDKIRFHIQDIEHIVSVSELNPETTLNTYLRKKLNLTGTKNMCLEGGCGSCIVVVQNNIGNAPMAVNSCLVSLLSCDGWKIRTIEGIGDSTTGYHPIQTSLVAFNGTQCGFCSSGMVMNMYALHKSGKMTMDQVENSFGGNICRCTGYRSILSAFKSLCSDANPELLGKYPDIEDLKPCQIATDCAERCNPKCDKRNPFYHDVANNSKWIKVFTLKELFDLFENLRPTSKYTFVAGNTARGVFKAEPFETYIDISDVRQLQIIEFTHELNLGANSTLTRTIDVLTELSDKPHFSYLKKVASHMDLIANVPVRNIGTLAGNLMMKYHNHEFPSDIFLLLETCHAKLRIIGLDDGVANHHSPDDFLKIDMNFKIISSIVFPPHADDVIFETYKIMPRAQNAHAIVNAGFLFSFDSSNALLKSATIVYGNINPDFSHATETERFLIGTNLFNNTILQKSYKILASELNPLEKPPEPSPEFRRELAIALFYKTILAHVRRNHGQLSARNVSGGPKLVRPISKSTQDYVTSENLYPLTQPVAKIEALAQSSGRAEYIEDMPDLPGQLYGSFVLAKAPPNSVITKIDAGVALKHPSIRAFYTKDDIPGDNNYMPGEIYPHKEEIFCNGTVAFYHQPLGLIVGTDSEEVQKAADSIQVLYDPPGKPPMISVRQILKSQPLQQREKISLDKTITGIQTETTESSHLIEGAFDIHHQYHFHMETQCCNVIPTEDGLDIYPSSQWLDPLQIAVADMLGVSNNKINVKVRRCGGAFGAKISRNTLIACAAALAAWKLKRPVKLALPLKTNMQVIGKRFPLSADYRIKCDDRGIISALSCKHYTDSGAGSNEIVMGYLLSAFTGTYVSDAFSLEMHTARTDTHANTWTRAPGTTEGLAAIESIMEHIAYSVGADPLDVRIANAADPELLKYVADFKGWADIDRRRADIGTFNRENRWKKRGLSVVPMVYRFDIPGFYSATVSIHHGDGSVSISHGGVEIGQGINTKAAQVCAFKLQIPLEAVAVLPTATSASPNCMFTGGSLTSEAVCHGVSRACEELRARMAPYKKGAESWRDLVEKCHRNFVNLTAMGDYSPKSPGLGGYKVYGVCGAEVLLDVLTGQHLVSRVDLLEDTGTTLSPNIDIGQVEGAFVMGLGYFTTEKIVFDPEGKILTDNTWTYKPPGFKDIPVDFRVKFPENNGNPVGVLNSKATAEPPFTLAVSVPLAIRNAVASSRSDSDSSQSKWYPFNGPTTTEDIFMNSLNKWEDYVL